MNTPRHRMIMGLAFMAILSCTQALAADKLASSPVDEDWKRVDAAMETVSKALKQSADVLRPLIVSYDTAAKAFLTKHPNDPRRWNLRFFEGVTLESRRNAGLPAQGDQLAIMKEILGAADADDEARSGASAVRVLAEYRALQSGGDERAWLAIAEEHLKKFPVHPAGQRIKADVEHVKSLQAFRGRAPELKFTAIDGREVDLSKLVGKVVLIDFWASYCELCNADMPGMVQTYEKLHPKGFEIVGICLDKEPLEMRKFIEGNQMTWPQYHDGLEWDGALVGRLGVHFVPTLWLVDRKGHVVCTDARGRLEELVGKLLAE